MGECSVYSSLQADSKVKFAAWPTNWRPPGADRLCPRSTTMNSRIYLAGAVDDSTINIVVVIIIIIKSLNTLGWTGHSRAMRWSSLTIHVDDFDDEKFARNIASPTSSHALGCYVVLQYLMC